MRFVRMMAVRRQSFSQIARVALFENAAALLVSGARHPENFTFSIESIDVYTLVGRLLARCNFKCNFLELEIANFFKKILLQNV